MTVRPEPHVYTVGELQFVIRDFLEQDFGSVWVEGELSGVKRHSSGHLYFALKDAEARLDAVMWRSDLQRLRLEPEEGMAVRARGYLTVYPRQGRYQMIVRGLQPVGAGPLQAQFEKLRATLEKEGLFAAEHKQPLPRFPRRVALITSPAGAAVRDLITVAQRRWPPVQLVVVPARVQGRGAAPEIAAAIREADGLGFDILIVTRGGGSLEDLWAFNEEPVARAIFHAKTPLVSAIGHEVDVTIADFVADARAATPSAAAEAVTPSKEEVAQLLDSTRRRLARALQGKAGDLRRRLEAIRLVRPFQRRLRDASQDLDAIATRLARGLTDRIRADRSRLETLAAKLDALSPLKVLARGYSVTLKDGKVLRRAADVAAGDALRTILAEGEIRSRAE